MTSTLKLMEGNFRIRDRGTWEELPRLIEVLLKKLPLRCRVVMKIARLLEWSSSAPSRHLLGRWQNTKC